MTSTIHSITFFHHVLLNVRLSRKSTLEWELIQTNDDYRFKESHYAWHLVYVPINLLPIYTKSILKFTYTKLSYIQVAVDDRIKKSWCGNVEWLQSIFTPNTMPRFLLAGAKLVWHHCHQLVVRYLLNFTALFLSRTKYTQWSISTAA